MISLREKLEAREYKMLAENAAKSADSKGRKTPEADCEIRTCFQRDRDRILHSKAFRRLKHKTQVFISPERDHYRTRLTHTLEVAQIARTIARGLFLNEDLTEAIALGHDLGHTPFGHAGEEVLDQIAEEGFRHNEQSLRVVDYLEKPGGLNLTAEVRDGIYHHTGTGTAVTLEGQVVDLCDRIAYINHDIDDAIRGGIISEGELPGQAIDFLGTKSAQRIDTMVKDVLKKSCKTGSIQLSQKGRKTINELRKFLFEKVYVGSKAKAEESKAKYVIHAVFYHFLEFPERLPAAHYQRSKQESLKRVVIDYVAGMTDRYIMDLFQELFLPKPWKYSGDE